MIALRIIQLTFITSALALSGNFVRIGNHEYLISDQKLNWFRAAHYCHSVDADLANIESASELMALSTHLKNIGKGDEDFYWFDGNDLGEQGQYYSLTTGRLMTFTKWARGEPNMVKGMQHCICLWKEDADFDMSDWECENPAYFICKPRKVKTLCRNSTTTPEPGSFAFLQEQLDAQLRQKFQQVGDDFYYFGETNVTWHEADQLCRKRGANLANIESDTELEAIENKLIASGKNTDYNLYWIDGVDAEHDGRLISLTNGEPLSYLNFDIWQPYRGLGTCIMLWKHAETLKMYEYTCDSKASYICKARKPEFVNVYGSPVKGIED